MTETADKQGTALSVLRCLFFGAPAADEPYSDYLPAAPGGELAKGDSRYVDDALISEEVAFIDAKRRKAKLETDCTLPPHDHITRIKTALEQGDKTNAAPRTDSTAGEGDTPTPYIFGLALSGGGIRSATFSLGVMQRLARAGVLPHVDYLSTVSGGGYIGAALSWWLSGQSGNPKPFGRAVDNFPYGTGEPIDPTATTDVLTYLRQNGNYLIPGAGLNIFSGIAIVLRAMILNLIVWIPVLAFLFLCIYHFGNMLPLAEFDTMLRSLEKHWISERPAGHNPLPGIYALAMVAAAFGAIMFLIASLTFSFLSWRSRASFPDARPPPRGAHASRGAQVSPPSFGHKAMKFIAIATLYGAIVTLLLALAIWVEYVGDANVQEISGELFRNWHFVAFFVATSVLFIEWIVNRTASPNERKKYYSVIAMILGIVALNGLTATSIDISEPENLLDTISLACGILAVIGGATFLVYLIALAIESIRRDPNVSLRYSGRRSFEKSFGFWFPANIALLVFASIPVSVAIADGKLAGGEGVLSVLIGGATALWGHFKSRSKDAPGSSTKLVLIIGSILLLYGVLVLSYRLSLHFTGSSRHFTILGSIFIFSLVCGWFANINYISIHRFYRDRLMEAFMPDYSTAQANSRGPASLADGFRMSELWQQGATGPFHIVNTNVVLVNSLIRKFRLRGGDNFILTPLYSGASATGWQLTRRFVKGEMTLASAMAISGAAANPRAGVGGTGATRNSFVSLAMTFLNLRLGYYVRRPAPKEPAQIRPNHFLPGGYYAVSGSGYSENSAYQELSDGGHFENLALYELIRRRAGLIIVCDGGQDAQASYSDFISALQRVGQDFGATFHFDQTINDMKSDPKQLIPRASHDTYPKGAEYSQKGYFVATVNYNARGGGIWPKTGVVIYLKTAMIKSLNLEAKGYKGAHPTFPDETTGDQFFDEPQFEAYRSVGYEIAGQMIKDLDLEEQFEGGRAVFETITNWSHAAHAHGHLHASPHDHDHDHDVELAQKPITPTTTTKPDPSAA